MHVLNYVLSTFLPVVGVVSARLMHLDNDKNMLEVRTDGFWGKRQGAWLLEDYCDYIISYVPLP